MRSFTLWYDPKQENEINPKVKINVNLWEEDSKKEFHTCFDFGFKIDDISNIKNINFYIPFDTDKNKISDLGKIISNNRLVNAIFNENFKTTDGNPKKLNVSALDDDINENFIIYALDIKNQINLINSKTSNDKNSKIIQIDLSEISLDDIKEYYFRIRIRVPNDQVKFIYNQLKSESAFDNYFTKTEVIDFRINDIRSSSEVLREKFENGSHFDIKSIHYLILRDASDIIIHHGNPISSRVLEKNTWDDYFDGNKEENVIAYHIKKKAKRKNAHEVKVEDEYEYLKDFSDLSRFKYKKSTWMITLTAIFAIIALELISNFLYSCIENLLNSL